MPHRQRRRLRTWLTSRPSGWSALVPLIALAAGLLFATSGAAARGTDLRSEGKDLPDLIREGTRANSRSSTQVDALRREVDRLTKEAGPGSVELRGINEKISEVSPAAGALPVEGPAVTVSLDDAKLPDGTVPDGFTVDDVVVHQQDVQGVVNALWRGGAEAMMIQDQRVISTSAVRCVGNTLILQGRVYSPPFVITAVGDPVQLQAALDADETVQTYRDYVAAVGLGYDVTTAASKRLPAYAGTSTLEHAKAMPGTE